MRPLERNDRSIFALASGISRTAPRDGRPFHALETLDRDSTRLIRGVEPSRSIESSRLELESSGVATLARRRGAARHGATLRGSPHEMQSARAHRRQRRRRIGKERRGEIAASENDDSYEKSSGE